jgi:hypothetical protein
MPAPTPKKPATQASAFAALIQRATGARAGDLVLVENIMRDDIFHSTLDWQTREQLTDAARQAFALLQSNRDLYEFGRVSALAVFQSMRAASAPNP